MREIARKSERGGEREKEIVEKGNTQQLRKKTNPEYVHLLLFLGISVSFFPVFQPLLVKNKTFLKVPLKEQFSFFN